MASKKSILILAIVLVFVLPLVFVMAGAILFKQTSPAPPKFKKEEVSLEDKSVLGVVELLDNKSRYSGQNLVIKGKVVDEEVVCSRKECPQEDPCCGCSEERDLFLVDQNLTVLSEKSKAGRLRLFEEKNQAICRRKINSCEYDCGDWQIDRIYDLAGVFFSDKIPPGWKIPLDFYFTVESKTELGGFEINWLTGGFENFFNDLKSLINRIRGSGYYMLP